MADSHDLGHSRLRDRKGYPLHPIYYTETNKSEPAYLYDSSAEAIGLGEVAESSTALQTDPGAADGSKVSILDTDHIWGVGGTNTWVWRAFTRGHNPIYMDCYPSCADATALLGLTQVRSYALRLSWHR